MQDCKEFKYDVVLSFAGEDRKYVEKVAKYLFNSGVKVFYDIYEDVDLWGKDLYQHLDDVYQNKAKYAVIFVSEAYGKKLWANHELKAHRLEHSPKMKNTYCQHALTTQKLPVSAKLLDMLIYPN